MNTRFLPSSPVLDVEQVRQWEGALFQGEEAREWPAMQAAGAGIARAVVNDFQELGGFPKQARCLVLVGKGHNGGDALIATQRLLERFPEATADLFLVCGERALRPLAARAWRELCQSSARGRVRVCPEGDMAPAYDLSLDGVLGFQFRPPLSASLAAFLRRANAADVRLRAAVDLPSGGGETDAFQADFTYATGVVKAPLFEWPQAGRIRHIDLGWTFPPALRAAAKEHVLSRRLLAPLTALRPPRSDKRDFGHLGVIGGSRRFPGAVLMTVHAALQSGVGLVTAFVPESLAAAYAAQLPEAMWVGWPETSSGGLALDGAHLVRESQDRLDAWVMGPGLAREPETLAWLGPLIKASTQPLVLDADALQPNLVRLGSAPRVLTPHAGEFARVAGRAGVSVAELAHELSATIVQKGPVTRLSDGGETYVSLFGGPVLARGGSGDLLAGLIGAQLAQMPQWPLLAAARGVVWQGLAADALARAQGAVAVTTTELLRHLSAALREAAMTD